MTYLEKKTTPIGDKEYKPLLVEWRTYHPHVKKVEEHVVALISPSNAMHESIYLVGMSPKTALNLLEWLNENKSLLEELAAQEAK